VSRRVLLKLSGEAIGPAGGLGIDAAAIRYVAAELAGAVAEGAGVAVVLGAGNLVRGRDLRAAPIARSDADRIGMLGTIMNGVALRGALAEAGVPAALFTATPIQGVGEAFDVRRAVDAITAGGVAILAGGTGHPYFTTDTAAALRALELGAQALLKGTKVDGVYSADPVSDSGAVRYDRLSFDEVLARGLAVMDQTAVALCRENRLPIVVFDLFEPGNVARAVRGEPIGTTVGEAR